ncbi:LacI family DNA-binding transcriptional regulator [Variovorax sp. MHTC-1]|uniref:LacI family DNA-binding transcriptional regulator n=1 Tax=Variovorax sp. MHTC-1 TaxID=2495593 RepID=UPI000F8892CA|nr:LacI family DNA-binding transcriptional regulator [Variovorax sp. MHTC-1]RST49464.1 LacI family DNA-binding transcriptional regulator [Variovorax sp. MHTC-1]
MSIQSVAERAGVSVATVSRVFNFPDKVTPATREHVERVAGELGYLPNSSARTLRTQRSRVLGVVLPTLLNPVFAECLQGIARAAAAGGYAIIPVTTGYQLDEEQRAVNLLMAGNVDGLILVVSNPATSAALERLRGAGLPYVLVYNRHPEHPCVSVDNEGAVGGAVARLVELGHRRIAMVSGTLAASDRAQQRWRGFLQGMAAAGLEPPALVEVPFIETAVDELRRFLVTAPRPTALVCSNDLLAIRSIRAAHLSGLQVPRDLSVIGFDGIALGEDLTPALSTVTQPNGDIGRHSVELLVQALAGGTVPNADASLVLPHALRTGESCAPVS